MTAWTLQITLASPFMFGGAPDLAFGVDDRLPRDEAGHVVLPGTLARGLLRDALDSMLKRGGGNLPGIADGAKLARLVFGAGSGEKTGSALEPGRGDDADVEGLAPRRGALVIADLLSPVAPAAKHITRIRIDEQLGSADEGALQAIEAPWPVGADVTFSGLVRLAGAIDAGEAKKIIELGLTALRQVGSFKSAGFGRVLDVGLFEPKAAAKRPAVKFKPAPAQRVAWQAHGAFLAAVERVASNIFRGGDIIPGGAIKGAIADMLAASGQMTPERSDLLARTIFGHARAAPRDARLDAVNTLPLPTPFCLACFGGDDVKAGDTLLLPGAPLGVVGGALHAPRYEIDWKDKDRKEVSVWRRERNLAAPLDLLHDPRTRTAIDYDAGTASYREDKGGGLFAQWRVLPKYRNDGALADARFVQDIAAFNAEDGPALADLLNLVASQPIFVGKLNTAFEITAAERAPSMNVNVINGANGQALFAVTLITDAVLCSAAELRAAKNDIAAVYGRNLPRALETLAQEAKATLAAADVTLVRFFARQRFAGGYQAMRYRADPDRYEPWVVTRAGTTFLFGCAASHRAAFTTALKRALACGLPEIDGQPHETAWRRTPFARSNGFGAVACHLAGQAPPKWLKSVNVEA